MSVGERIRQVRKEKCLTLDKFGDRIGIKKSALSQFERGTANPSNQTVLSICREFGVREEWLRTGEGPMKDPEPPKDDLDAVLDQWELPREFRGLFIAYRNLKTEAEREAVRQFIRDAAMEITNEQEADGEKHPSDEQLEREAREEAEEYYRLRLAEKREIEADAKARGLTGTEPNTTNSGRGGGGVA